MEYWSSSSIYEGVMFFLYNDKYGPGHWCKIGTFILLEANHDALMHEVKGDTEEDDDPNPSKFVAINFHAILGKPTATTIKLQGTIHKRDVLILVDSVSTHNFVWK